MIIVGGENLIDFIQLEGDKAAPVYQANAGGGPYNCARALGLQGVSVGYLTPISGDSLGRLLASGIEQSGVRILSPRRTEPTSLAVVSLQDGVPSYQFYRDNTAERQVTPEGLNSCTPDTARAVYIGALALTGGADATVWADYYCAMKTRGLFTALDPNIRATFIHDRDSYLSRLYRVLANTDLLKLSNEDLAWLVPDTCTQDAAVHIMQQSAAKLMVVTLGAEGAFALTDGCGVSVDAAPVKNLRDTVGSGDTFMATLLARLERTDMLSAENLATLDGAALEDLLNWAACAAALNCEQDGCNPPDLQALEWRMSA
jgi:fructokinase